MPQKSEKKLDTHGSQQQFQAREELLKLFKETPIPDDEILVNLGLYTRSIILAKTLYLNELYQHILPIPGIVIEFGVWWGANLALFDNFRNVYEPYNRLRKIVGFDTFEGYKGITEVDGESDLVSVVAEGGYSTSKGYEEYLKQVLDMHAADNVLSHIKKYEIVKGNVLETIDQYFEDNPETIVALTYFDMALYEPTKKCLEVIKPHLVKGSIIAMDELNSHDFPGETIALKEVFGLDQYRIVRSQFLPDRAYVIIE